MTGVDRFDSRDVTGSSVCSRFSLSIHKLLLCFGSEFAEKF